VQKSDGTWVWLKQHDNVSTGGTFTFSVADNKAMYTAIGGYENRPAKILCITYNSGIEVGRKETIGTVYGAIPATINLNNFNIGTTSVPATLSNRQSNGNFYYKATLTFGSFTKSFDITTDSFNIPFTELEVDEMYQQVTTANSKVGNIHISSKYGGYDGVEINDNYPINQSKSFIAFVVGSSPIFTTFEYADTNATTNTIKGSGNESWIIQNKSTLRATVPDANKAEPQNYAIIDKYTATLNGETKTVYKPFPTDIVFDFGTVDSPTNINLVVKAYDSRGNVKSVTKAVKMVPWEKPEIRTQATRENGFGSDVTLTLEGDISPLTVNGEDKNSLVSAGVKYRQRQKNGTWGAYTVFLGQTITMPEYSVDDVWIDMNTTTAYEIEVQVTDKLGNSTSFLEVKVGIPIMHIDDGMSNVGINKLPAPDYALDISGDLATSGDIFEKGTKLEDKYAPTGVIQMFAGIATPPTGWLLCRGQAVSRETYTRLFSTIGVLYGAGDGSTTFNLPDLRGRVPIGVNIGDSDFEEVNKTGGEKTHTLTTNEIPSHAHNVGNYNEAGYVYTHTTFLPVSGGSNRGFISNIVSAQTGGGHAHNNLQPYITLNYIIRT
jgi:microcystin-dependent protein